MNNNSTVNRKSHLKKSCHGPEAVPEHGGEVTDHLPLLAELQERGLPGVGGRELDDPLVDLVPVQAGLARGGGGGGGGAGHGAARHVPTGLDVVCPLPSFTLLQMLCFYFLQQTQ